MDELPVISKGHSKTLPENENGLFVDELPVISIGHSKALPEDSPTKKKQRPPPVTAHE